MRGTVLPPVRPHSFVHSLYYPTPYHRAPRIDITPLLGSQLSLVSARAVWYHLASGPVGRGVGGPEGQDWLPTWALSCHLQMELGSVYPSFCPSLAEPPVPTAAPPSPPASSHRQLGEDVGVNLHKKGGPPSLQQRIIARQEEAGRDRRTQGRCPGR